MTISEIAAKVTLFACKVARRGKAAKGTIEVSTLGKPVNDSTGVARDFDYSHFAAVPVAVVQEAATRLASHVNQSIALAMGIDLFLKSQTLMNESVSTVLAGELLAQDLAESMEQAKILAINWLRMIAQSEVDGTGLDLAFLINGRKAFVAKKKAANEWKVTPVEATDKSVSTDKTPRLVRK